METELSREVSIQCSYQCFTGRLRRWLEIFSFFKLHEDQYFAGTRAFSASEYCNKKGNANFLSYFPRHDSEKQLCYLWIVFKNNNYKNNNNKIPTRLWEREKNMAIIKGRISRELLKISNFAWLMANTNLTKWWWIIIKYGMVCIKSDKMFLRP